MTRLLWTLGQLVNGATLSALSRERERFRSVATAIALTPHRGLALEMNVGDLNGKMGVLVRRWTAANIEPGRYEILYMDKWGKVTWSRGASSIGIFGGEYETWLSETCVGCWLLDFQPPTERELAAQAARGHTLLDRPRFGSELRHDAAYDGIVQRLAALDTHVRSLRDPPM